MKNIFTLCFSIFKGNKGFSIGLLLLFFFGATLIVMSSILPVTISTSLNRFIDDYHISQATVVTDPMSSEVEGLSDIDGVKSVESQMIIDTNVKISDDVLKQMRLFTVEDDGFRKYYFNEKIDVEKDEKSIWVTLYFADFLDLHAGDMLEVKFPSGYESLKISAIVSSPESSSCCYDDTYYAEDYDFGNIFMSRKDFEDLYKIKGYSNTRSFLFNDNLSIEKQEEAVSKAEEILGDKVVSSELYEKSKSKTVFDSNMESLTQTCEVFPYMIYIALLVCSALFLYQTINNQRKKIGLLRALGYTSRKIIFIYILYVLIVLVIAIPIGWLVASVFNEYVFKEYQSIFSIPEIYYVIPIKTYIMLAILVITGVVSCLISSQGITRIDPSEAYSSTVVSTMPYRFKTPLFKRMHVFNKISIAKIFKNKKRLIMLSLSIAACIVLSFMATACLISKEKSNEATFGNRLNYDLLVYYDGDTILDEMSSLDGVSKAEKGIVFTERLYLNDKDLNLQYNAIEDNSSLVVPKDIKYNRVNTKNGVVLEQYVADYFGLKVGDSIRVKDVDLEITGIASEYVNYIQYMSFNTAKKLGYSKPNCCFIRLNNKMNEDEAFKKISEIDGFKYMKFLNHQEMVKHNNQKALDLVYYALIFLSIFIGLVIIINMVAISVSERKFEYGTLLALGTDTSKFVSMVLIENVLQYIVASLFACVPCYFLTEIILKSMSSPQLNFPFVEIPLVYALAFGLALIYIIAGIIFTLAKIKKINPAVTLNIRE